ncbi:hypothetical protein THOM_2890 [Trachipleistophora hominis]|uniref:Uncharacterized protein n=1 Tax=Trachipleistophora hominis TaxID=72359 RepID=L7JSD4_TRAHO|nr:hypothetical protein THOM_2890 [Trachipleistophora hominis]
MNVIYLKNDELILTKPVAMVSPSGPEEYVELGELSSGDS